MFQNPIKSRKELVMLNSDTVASRLLHSGEILHSARASHEQGLFFGNITCNRTKYVS